MRTKIIWQCFWCTVSFVKISWQIKIYLQLCSMIKLHKTLETCIFIFLKINSHVSHNIFEWWMTKQFCFIMERSWSLGSRDQGPFLGHGKSNWSNPSSSNLGLGRSIPHLADSFLRHLLVVISKWYPTGHLYRWGTRPKLNDTLSWSSIS